MIRSQAVAELFLLSLIDKYAQAPFVFCCQLNFLGLGHCHIIWLIFVVKYLKSKCLGSALMVKPIILLEPELELFSSKYIIGAGARAL